MIRAKKLRNCV